MEFKEFRLGDLFDVDGLWVYGKNKQWVKRSSTKQKGSYPVISGITLNNGVNYYTLDTPQLSEVFKDSLTISTRGEYSGTVTYHDAEFVLANNILVMQMPNLSKGAKLYLASVISSLSYGGYTNYPRKETLKEDMLLLPTSDGINPDYAYMEKYISELEQERISELEQERISELEQYLSGTGLDDYELTEEDTEILSGLRGKVGSDCTDVSENGEEVKAITYKEFRVGNLFEPLKVGYKGKYKKIGSAMKEPSVEYCVPLTCAKTGDQGIMYWGKKDDFITYVNTISIIADGAVSAGLVYAQPEEAGAYSHSYFIRVKGLNVSHHTNKYLACVLNNVTYAKYSRERAPRWDNKVENDMITLPTSDGINPDYAYMEKYMRVMEKMVIKGVVDYKDAVIEETKRQASLNP